GKQLQGFVDLAEAFYGEELGVHLVDLDGGVQDGFQVEVEDLAVAFEDVGAFAVGADEAAAVDLDAAVLADEAEFDGVPEEAANSFQVAFERGFVGRASDLDGGAELAVMGKEIGENR